MVFNMWVAFGIIVLATTVGMALPYLLARRYMQERAGRMIQRYKHTKAVLMCVDRAGPFKVSLLVRLGPLPYSVENYGEQRRRQQQGVQSYSGVRNALPAAGRAGWGQEEGGHARPSNCSALLQPTKLS